MSEIFVEALSEIHSLLGEIEHDLARPLAERINRGTGGRELALCRTKIQEARMWAAAAQQELTSPHE